MKSLHSYGDVYNLGHKQVLTIFDSEVNIEEKIDGSQFSFGVVDGELKMRSKGAEIFLTSDGGNTSKMFTQAVATSMDLFNKGLLHPAYIYRCEYLIKPKHNVLCYDRVPAKNLIIFDIDYIGENYLSYEEKKEEAERLGLECVPLLFKGKIEDFDYDRL